MIYVLWYVDIDFLKESICVPLWHHERFDGSGYPDGLKGGEIPLEARTVAIFDVYDTLLDHRPYKKPISHEQALEIIRDGSDSYFDPELTSLFCAQDPQIWRKLAAVSESQTRYDEVLENCIRISTTSASEREE